MYAWMYMYMMFWPYIYSVYTGVICLISVSKDSTIAIEWLNVQISGQNEIHVDVHKLNSLIIIVEVK